jgi:hypothetical protein
MTIQQLLSLPKDELRVMVATIIDADACCPDYPNDLNAMAELEDGLTDEEKNRYVNHLSDIVDLFGEDRMADFKLLSATAHHRAVAYVCTKLKL